MRVSRIPKDNRGTMIVDGKPVGVSESRRVWRMYDYWLSHKGAGLFEVACRFVEKSLSRPVQSTIVTLGGFPATRVEKHLKRKVFDFNPHISSSNSGLLTRSVQFELEVARPIAATNAVQMAVPNPVRL